MKSSARVWRRLAALVAASTLMLGLVAMPAAAQGKGPPTSNPGNPKNSDRGNFPVGPPGNPHHTFAASVVQAGKDVSLALQAGTLTTVEGRAIPAAAQARLLGVLAPNVRSETQLPPGPELAAALVAHNRGAETEVRTLVTALQALLGDPGRLTPAVIAFNDFVNASSPAFLAEPPAEFLAIRAALAPLALAATRSAAAGGTD